MSRRRSALRIDEGSVKVEAIGILSLWSIGGNRPCRLNAGGFKDNEEIIKSKQSISGSSLRNIAEYNAIKPAMVFTYPSRLSRPSAVQLKPVQAKLIAVRPKPMAMPQGSLLPS